MVALIQRDIAHPASARRRDMRDQSASHLVVARRGCFLPTPLPASGVDPRPTPRQRQCSPNPNFCPQGYPTKIDRPDPPPNFAPHRILPSQRCYTAQKLYAPTADDPWNKGVDLYV